MNLLPADDHNGCDDATFPGPRSMWDLVRGTHPTVAILAASVALAICCVAVAG